MSHKLAIIEDGELHQPGVAAPIALDSPAWFAWLEDECHHSFHATHPCGDFTARKERKQRGQLYWVAYRQVNNKLYKVYLGKSTCLTTAHLRAAAEALAHKVSEAAHHSGESGNGIHAPPST
ncbi:MAG TPA: hypothetical protein VGD69_05255 [Herpetosiphonaceae bacterium]